MWVGINSIFGQIAVIKWILTVFFCYSGANENGGLANVKCEYTFTQRRTQWSLYTWLCNHKVIYFRPLNGHKSNFHMKTVAWKTIRGCKACIAATAVSWQEQHQGHVRNFMQSKNERDLIAHTLCTQHSILAPFLLGEWTVCRAKFNRL